MHKAYNLYLTEVITTFGKRYVSHYHVGTFSSAELLNKFFSSCKDSGSIDKNKTIKFEKRSSKDNNDGDYICEMIDLYFEE